MKYSLLCAIGLTSSLGSEIKHVRLKPTKEMSRAELFLWKPEQPVKAIIVFCPGHNGVGKGFVQNKQWQAFARKHALALCGLSFSSNYNLTRRGLGYSHAERGSGKLLLEALDKAFPRQNISLYLYGYSAGARFTASFVAWKPARVSGWCASGVGRWPELPMASQRNIPQGIVACGEYDAVCYWSSQNYFQRGRKQGRKWTWISLKNLGHGYSSTLDQCVKLFIKQATKTGSKQDKGDWFDLDTKKSLSIKQSNSFPEFSVWVPADLEFTKLWHKHHHP